jgi:hypothetical protein
MKSVFAWSLRMTVVLPVIAIITLPSASASDATPGGLSGNKAEAGSPLQVTPYVAAQMSHLFPTQPSPFVGSLHQPTTTHGDADSFHVATAVKQPQDADGLPEDSAVMSAERELSRPLSSVSLAEAHAGTSTDGEELRQPTNDAAVMFQSFGRQTSWPTGNWVVHTPNRNFYRLCHNPLYFEDPNLERCGRSHGVFTEFVSAARFFGRVPLTPYMMAANSPDDCVRALPDCPTCCRFDHHDYLPPLDRHATGTQALATVGLIFLIP